MVKNKGLVAKVSISESDIHEVSLGNKVTLSGQAFGSKTYSGTVAAIETSAKKSLFSTSQEAVVEATISLRDPDDSLKAGYSVKAKIVTGDTKDVSIVPYEAVMQDDLQNEYVYVYENSKVYKQYIETGLELANGIEVTEGLTADSYIVETPERVREDGEQVMVFQNKSP